MSVRAKTSTDEPSKRSNPLRRRDALRQIVKKSALRGRRFAARARQLEVLGSRREARERITRHGLHGESRNLHEHTALGIRKRDIEARKATSARAWA